MDKKEMIERYDYLYNKMSTSNEVRYMMIFGQAEKNMFNMLVESHPDLAQKWLNKLEPICWNNYLCDCEAKEIEKSIVNQDNTKGFHWDYATFKNAVESNGLELEDKPYYNDYALWVTSNMIYSDHANSIAQDMDMSVASEVPNDKMFLSCYRKAIEKLKDKDRPYFIRSYFKEYL